MSKLELVPVTLRAATSFVEQHHRHHKPPQGGLFAVGVSNGDDVVGVAIVGMPVARLAADGWTVEVTRCCVLEGHKNAASKLYGACWRAARALGWRRLITYTLVEEPGTSLRAAGWKEIGECGGGSWSRKNRPRVDEHPMQVKIRWEAE